MSTVTITKCDAQPVGVAGKLSTLDLSLIHI